MAVLMSVFFALSEICGEAALYVEPTDVERIFEGARRLLAEPDLRAELVAKGHARARRFTWRQCARHTLLAYRAATEPENPLQLRRSL
jgi:glycosyltransferase involved in cell wall biosynthesis